MKRQFISLLFIAHFAIANIHVIYPKSLKTAIKKVVGESGSIEYTISTFGILDYQARLTMIVEKWDSPTGCDMPEKPILNQDETKKQVAYIMQRGTCSYHQKAINIHSVGGMIGIIVLKDEKEDPRTIIPVSDTNGKL